MNSTETEMKRPLCDRERQSSKRSWAGSRDSGYKVAFSAFHKTKVASKPIPQRNGAVLRVLTVKFMCESDKVKQGYLKAGPEFP